MRIPIREQLGLLVLLTSLTALAVISIVTWVNNYKFVVGIRSSRLELTVGLKAAQLSSNLVLLQSIARSSASSLVVQYALQRYHDQRNNTAANWLRAQQDLGPALSSGGGRTQSLLQAIIYSKNGTGPGGPYGLLNVTGDSVADHLQLPYQWPNGTSVKLGDAGMGYPPEFYPNLTYTSTPINETYNRSSAEAYGIDLGGVGSALLLGPFQINATYAVMSLTLPVINNTSSSDLLGFMSFLVSAQLLYDVVSSPVGLDNTGECLILGPSSPTNRFPTSDLTRGGVVTSGNSSAVGDLNVRFVLPPVQNDTRGDRHKTTPENITEVSFPAKRYPAVLNALTRFSGALNNAGTLISSQNEEAKKVSVGYAMPAAALVDWVLLVEQDRAEAFAPIVRLRNILVACVFGTAGAIVLAVFPIAHFFVRPIRRLREATQRTMQPPGYTPDNGSLRSSGSADRDHSQEFEIDDEGQISREPKLSLGTKLRRWRRGRRRTKAQATEEARRRTFKIPGKVPDRKHVVFDELTDLTQTFNEMSDELMMRYEKLEEKVYERTRELEMSKKAAEAANESKTLFIANISHELKTPLNGILGMCAVCMGEEDMTKIKRSLGIIYKSGDLLLHLLTDLLTFSKNQIGQQLSLEEREFRLVDISSQILSIFEKQAKEGNITLRATFSGPDGGLIEKGYGPIGTGRIKDMCLWGDQNRILQVIINLVSNSLKFTPPGQSVEVRIKCVGEAEKEDSIRKASLNSKQTGSRQSKVRHRPGSGSNTSVVPTPSKADEDAPKHMDTALAINAMEPKPYAQVRIQERSPSPPPLNSRILMFEFEVEDTGPGIPESLHERVFEPFVQGDLGLSKKYGGTGLGLSICSQLAKLMQGSIGLRSQIGVGSTFTMRIPLRFTKESADSFTSSVPVNQSARNSIIGNTGQEEAPGSKIPANDSSSSLSLHSAQSNNAIKMDSQTAAKPRLVGLSQPFFAPNPTPGSPKSQMAAMEAAATDASKRGDRIRVLVAEDNKVNQEVVMRMLKLEDIYDIHVAKDGQEAYDMVKESMEQKRVYSLIFMDIQMPNVDGLQSTRLIREMGFSAPIVALTAFAEESNVKECMDSGMNYFLAKPIKRPALKQVLKTYCATIPEEAEVTTSEEADQDASS
ncbi:MAG: Histidine kinase [Sclerophora amabilis]|nr:MAG: Histidine kinase [Sclerophora amabilis]